MLIYGELLHNYKPSRLLKDSWKIGALRQSWVCHLGPASQARYFAGSTEVKADLAEVKEDKKSRILKHFSGRNGMRLTDYVNENLVDVNMARNIYGKKRFSYNSEEVPESLRGVAQENMKWQKIDLMEALCILCWQVQQYRDGAVDEDLLLKYTKRVRYYVDIPHMKLIDGMFEVLDNNAGKSGFILRDVIPGNDPRIILTWVQCFTASKMSSALESMKEIPYENWPVFLVLYTLKRRCDSRLSAYRAVQLFQRQFKNFDVLTEVMAYNRILRICHRYLIDFVPVITRIFLLHMHPESRVSLVYNNLLWSIANFGVSWNHNDVYRLIEAQKSVVVDMAKHNVELDTKGYLSLAYTSKDIFTERSREILKIVKNHDYNYSREELICLERPADSAGDNKNILGRFPYKEAVYCMDILVSEDYSEALNIVDRLPREIIVKPIVWTTLLIHLIRKGELSRVVMEAIWQKICSEKVRLSNFLVQKLMRGFRNDIKALQVIELAQAQGLKITINSASAPDFLYINNESDLNHARIIMSSLQYNSVFLYDRLISAEAKFQPEKVWRTYSQLLAEGYEPTVRTLQTLCISGANRSLIWDELYASQRCVVEFKSWVRGADSSGSDVQDPFKVYPTDDLFCSYIVMLGKSHYQEELREVLPWMGRLKFRPKKLTLCALMAYSPEGKFLRQHAEIVKGEWPTEEELEAYQRLHLRQK